MFAALCFGFAALMFGAAYVSYRLDGFWLRVSNEIPFVMIEGREEW